MEPIYEIRDEAGELVTTRLSLESAQRFLMMHASRWLSVVCDGELLAWATPAR